MMQSIISPIIQAQELLTIQGLPELILVDARVGTGIKDKYLVSHLKGALHVDLDKDLAHVKPNAAEGGRHPLPSPDRFVGLIEQMGISPDSHVVVYDDKSGANAAARFWWMMKSIGHQNVQVLNGGMDAALGMGFPLRTGQEQALSQSSYKADAWILPLADIDEVERLANDKNALVIDVRDAYRYNGESEPIDLVAGHIPGAINIPFTENLDTKGFFKSPEVLKEKYLKLTEDKNNVIVHCGSGVTACHTLLAMSYAGLEIPKLYVGSWSEWSRNNKPIGRKS